MGRLTEQGSTEATGPENADVKTRGDKDDFQNDISWILDSLAEMANYANKKGYQEIHRELTVTRLRLEFLKKHNPVLST